MTLKEVALTTYFTVKRLVENRIKTLKGCHQNTQKKRTLKDPAGKQILDKLHEDYVLAPADKAGNNVIICKQYYKEIRLQITPKSQHTYAVMRL